jgi:hypothetical protein
MNLSTDIISKIFDFADLKDICRFMQASRKLWTAPRFREFKRDFIVAKNAAEFEGAPVPYVILNKNRKQLMRYLISRN